MSNVLSLLVLSAALWAGAVAQDQRATDNRTRDVFVTVLDSRGNPATGLTAADFTVREDGVAREVLRAQPADAALSIVILVDDSQAATPSIAQLRDGLNKFIDRMAGKAEIGIVTIGERPTIVAERTRDVALQKKGVSRIFARTGAGAYLLEGLIDVSRGLQKREAQRPVIIALTTEGVEFSTAQYQNVLKEIYASGAAFHVLALGTPSDSLSDEMRNRNMVLAEGTEGTGGRREQLLSDMAISGALDKLADELLNQYVVTYARPDALIPPERVQVTVNKPGLTARARTRLPSSR